MKSKVIVSVIIPVFNGASFLFDVYTMMENQTFHDWECIFIDDGSTDDSLDILTKFARNDDRFSVLTQPNMGVSAARNVGIEASVGEYICMIDCDDYIHPDYISYLYELINIYDADMSCCAVLKLNSRTFDSLDNRADKRILYDSRSATEDFFYRRHLIGYPFLKLIKKDYAKEVSFVTSMKSAEDEVFTFQVIRKCKTIVYGGRNLYLYYQNPESATHGKLKAADFEYSWTYMHKHIEPMVSHDELIFNAYTVREFIWAIDLYLRIENEDCESFKNELVSFIDNSKYLVLKNKCASISNRILALIGVVATNEMLFRACKLFLSMEAKGYVQRRRPA
ncbi:glycosyltransferase family 2 protein [Butyrivibrio sp. FCS006]|uniref:glycosyltransferase family 2 protein n=1 Tax=Butyrivibrio sp. FCS006 TaxID=1280684 RepID=UPI00041F0EB1|nr:glycosyltransferase family 2 protein [Butyrivibrio sp. FCS006]